MGATSAWIAELAKPFEPRDLEWKVQACGEKNGKIWARVLTYITAPAIMDRLDDVVGPENWRVQYTAGPDGGVMAGLSIKIEDEWIEKWDGAENTDIEAIKGGISNAFKRAARCWGIGRYLYKVEANFANIREDGEHSGKTKDGKFFYWNPPALPAWALPAGTKPQKTTPKAEAPAEDPAKEPPPVVDMDLVARGKAAMDGIVAALLKKRDDGEPLFTDEDRARVKAKHAGKKATEEEVLSREATLKELETFVEKEIGPELF